ncbi:GNAT family N-acetyltransferase [Marinilactibacillus sp. XAAS-LB27]|uniref:GNAT family N-acetyltransferase n=1 Tax=Marinilactibacillus sp. XAAS-LB27 TaxID=3114538 RepID=UPI002E174F3F|nr:GNAT family N-acetyltransferase [Marinilactibacillus sp. XAAS-LB27]
MQLRKLLITDEVSYREYVKSWKSEKIVPTSSNFNKNPYRDFLQQLIKAEEGMDQWVPSETYFLFLEENEIAGAINCRYQLNDQLKYIGGHIGYGISPEHRRKGLAQLMLGKVLPLFKERGIERILLTANDDNVGSVQVILNHYGKRASSGIEESGKTFGRYWITI